MRSPPHSNKLTVPCAETNGVLHHFSSLRPGLFGAHFLPRGGPSWAACPLSVCVSVHPEHQKTGLFEPGNSLISPIGAPKRRVLPCEKNCKLRCSRARQGQLYFTERVRLRGRMAAPCARNSACLLGRKPAQKGGTPLAGGQRKGPQGREMSPKVPRGRPQKCLPDQCGGWKSDEVLHFFRAWQSREFVGVGGRERPPTG